MKWTSITITLFLVATIISVGFEVKADVGNDPLAVTISPTQARILLGQSQTFTSSVSGGTTGFNFSSQYVSNPIYNEAGGNNVGWPEVTYNGSTYFLYYSHRPFPPDNIYYATSTNGLSFTYRGVALTASAGGSWENAMAECHSVFKFNTTHWIMYYCAANSSQTYNAGIAFSTDLKSWTRYSNNPIFSLGADEQIGDPNVIKLLNGTYIMYYAIQPETWKTSLATSTDGLTWTKYSDGNPVLDVTAGTSYSNSVAPTAIWEENGYVYLLTQSEDASGVWGDTFFRTPSNDLTSFTQTNTDPSSAGGNWVIPPVADTWDSGFVGHADYENASGTEYIYYEGATDPNTATYQLGRLTLSRWSSYAYQWVLNGTAVPRRNQPKLDLHTHTNRTLQRLPQRHRQPQQQQAQSNIVGDILVYSPLSASITPTSVNITVGGSQLFNSTVAGGIPSYTYQWYSNDTAVPGATSPTWTFTPASAGIYRIYLRVGDNYTDTAQSNNATANVTSQLAVIISPAHVMLYYGQSQTFSASVSSGIPPYSYQWVLNGTAVPGATSPTWTFTPRANGNYNVYVNVTDNLNNKAQSNIVSDVNAYSVNLLLTVGLNQATYTKHQLVTLTVDVLNQLNPSLKSTLTATVTGPNGYFFYDFQPISVASGAVGEYSFDWVVPNVAGTYVVETSLTPSLLTAYDTFWLVVS